jgi:hypothetical protein
LEVSVDPKILEKSPLTPRQKDILHRIDILKEPSTNVAKHYGVTKGTMSKCHSTALKRYNEFASLVKMLVADEAEKLRAKLAQHDSQLTGIYQFLADYFSDYLSSLRLVTDQIGPFRAKNCVHNFSGKCNKWPSLLVGPRICGICVDFVDKETTDAIDGHVLRSKEGGPDRAAQPPPVVASTNHTPGEGSS